MKNSFGFVLEFHLPYLVLRPEGAPRDSRGRRRRHKLPAGGYDALLKNSQNWEYHEAQISFLLVGPDEWFWTAYCLVDTYFGSEREPVRYLGSKTEPAQPPLDPFDPPLDPPSGGTIVVDEPIWNPREYFLHVLSARLEQVSQEWADLVAAMHARLVTYVWIPKPPI